MPSTQGLTILASSAVRSTSLNPDAQSKQLLYQFLGNPWGRQGRKRHTDAALRLMPRRASFLSKQRAIPTVTGATCSAGITERLHLLHLIASPAIGGATTKE